MKKKFLTSLMTCATVFALTACGGGGVFAGSYGDYIDSVKGKVVTKLIYHDDPTTADVDESKKSLDVEWYKYTESLIINDADNNPVLHENYVHAKLEDGFEIKTMIDGLTQEHLIIDVERNEEKENILKTAKTPATVFTVNAFVFDRQTDSLYYHHNVKDEETILYDIENPETPDIIGETYSLYFNQFYKILESFYDPIIAFGNINNLKLADEASKDDTIFSSYSWDALKYIDFKTPANPDTSERLLVSTKLTPCDQLNLDSALKIFSPKQLFYKSASVHDINGNLLAQYLFDLKEWNKGNKIPDDDFKKAAIAPESQPEVTEPVA